MNLKRIKKQLIPDFIDYISKNTNNPRFNREQLDKFVGDTTIDFFCLEDNDNCLAVCVLKKYPADNIIYLNEMMSLKKGYGKKLLEMLLKKYSDIWWMADYTAGESLLDFYRQFNVKEVNIGPSRWSRGKDHHIFYQVSNDKNEKIILDTMEEWKK